jgi:hypothetical protein
MRIERCRSSADELQKGEVGENKSWQFELTNEGAVVIQTAAKDLRALAAIAQALRYMHISIEGCRNCRPISSVNEQGPSLAPRLIVTRNPQPARVTRNRQLTSSNL